MHVLDKHAFHLFHIHALIIAVKQDCILVYCTRLDRPGTFHISKALDVGVTTIITMNLVYTPCVYLIHMLFICFTFMYLWWKWNSIVFLFTIPWYLIAQILSTFQKLKILVLIATTINIESGVKCMHILDKHVFHLFHLHALNIEVKQHSILFYCTILDRQNPFHILRNLYIGVNAIINMNLVYNACMYLTNMVFICFSHINALITEVKQYCILVY